MKIKNIEFKMINPNFLGGLAPKIAGDYECSIPYTFHAILTGKNNQETHAICHSLVYAQVRNKKVHELSDAKECGNGAESWHVWHHGPTPTPVANYEDSEEYTIECIEHSNKFINAYNKFTQELKKELNKFLA